MPPKHILRLKKDNRELLWSFNVDVWRLMFNHRAYASVLGELIYRA